MLFNKKFGEIALILTVILFLWVSIFGLIYNMNGMNMGVMKTNCLFSTQNEPCPMSIGEHINLWQGMFTALPQNNNFGLLGLLILAATLFAILTLWKYSLFELSEHVFSRWKIYTKQHIQQFLYKIETTHWLSLFENSPSFI
ncbi:MAG: hypothetical protein P4L63_00900 [Candidatus Pacebacteria bacterium]|nr:hypothetical protein [Candidatus Paceibacterota bacterium]